VLQHEYRDLAVMPDRFTVTLSFSGRPYTLVVPFSAVRTFIDPSVKFGLKFDDQDEGEDEEAEAESPSAPDVEPGPNEGGADVVSLDRFRKQ
jgi:hypothetical protein